jgi:hypothetical protein
MPDSDFLAALRALHEGVVDLPLWGSGGCTKWSAGHAFDLDIVPARDEANVAKLPRVLDAMDGIYRMQPERLKPEASHLRSPGHHNLITNCGPWMCWERSATDWGRRICCRTPLRWRPVGECGCVS